MTREYRDSLGIERFDPSGGSDLKGSLANERIGALLVLANLAESNSSGAVTVGSVERRNVSDETKQ